MCNDGQWSPKFYHLTFMKKVPFSSSHDNNAPLYFVSINLEFLKILTEVELNNICPVTELLLIITPGQILKHGQIICHKKEILSLDSCVYTGKNG